MLKLKSKVLNVTIFSIEIITRLRTFDKYFTSFYTWSRSTAFSNSWSLDSCAIKIMALEFRLRAKRSWVFTKVSGHVLLHVRISNDLRAIAYPHPTIRSKYLWAHSFRFMFQFGRIDTCLFTCKLPLIHSPLVGILLTNRYYPLCRRKTYFLHYPWAVLYPIITLLTAHCHLDNALMNLIFPYLCFRYFLNNYEIWLKRHRPAVFLLTRDVRIFDLINFDRLKDTKRSWE